VIHLTKEQCRQAMLGGLLLGGGGGGTLAMGERTLDEAFRYADSIPLARIDELRGEEILVNVSIVGTPSAKDIRLTAENWKTALKSFEAAYGGKIGGFTSCENGAASTTNGWVIAAVTGLPVVDAPSDGRAHPTGAMGSIGLNTLPDYETIQTAVGGTGRNYLEMTVRGGMDAASHLIRQAAVADGGLVAVLRNPVTADYAASHAAVGGFSQALEIGRGYLDAAGDGGAFIRFLERSFDAEVLGRGVIRDYSLTPQGGYDVGSLTVADGTDFCRLLFWNEYMLAEENGRRAATFPDLICTLDPDTGEAISTAEAADGRRAAVLRIPRRRMLLGAGLRQEALYREVQDIVGQDMLGPNRELFCAE
jgi:DUF917 family protein